jgi:sec-independent protein translocase protein TatC
LFWHGVVFESPVIFYVLARIGIITANQMLKYWRHAMVAAAAFAGFIAPVYDPVTMLIVTFLLFAIYMGSIGLVIVGVPGSYTRKKVGDKTGA